MLNLKAVALLVVAPCCVSYTVFSQTASLGLFGSSARKVRSNLTTAVQPYTTQQVRVDLYRDETYLNEDQTYTQTITEAVTLLTPNAIMSNQSMMSPSYYLGYQTVKLLEAYVQQPDGTKIQVPPANVFTTTVPADPNAPGFDTGLVQSVAFPQLKKGSKTYVRWEYKQLKPPSYRYANVSSPFFNLDTLHTEISVNLPDDVYVQWAKRGPYQEKEVHINGRHIISAVIGPQLAQTPENYMTASTDSAPFFEISTIRSWQEIADTTWLSVQPSQEVTPQIQQMVTDLIGKKTGKEAAKILHDWVASNIYYMAIMLDPRMGYVPMTATQIIFDRYTDCKGHSSLLQTFLKAAGIESYPVLVSWDNSLTQYPLPINSFDHEMLYIPSLDVYANPTDSYNPFGSPLEQTNYDVNSLQVLADKPVLIAKLNNQGPALVKTPPATPEQNQYHLTSSMTMDLRGDIQASGKITGTGIADSTLRGYLSQEKLSQLMTTTLNNNGIAGSATANGTAAKDLSQPMVINYTWQANTVAQASSEQLLFLVPAGPDLFPIQFFNNFLNQTGTRRFPIVVGAGIFDWNNTLTLPVSYQMKALPRNLNFTNRAGNYTANYAVTNGQLKVHRTLTLARNVYQPSEYLDLYTLLSNAIRDTNAILSIAPIAVPFPGIPTDPAPTGPAPTKSTPPAS